MKMFNFEEYKQSLRDACFSEGKIERIERHVTREIALLTRMWDGVSPFPQEDNDYGTRTFATMLHATYAGRFYLPAAKCEAMYDARKSAATRGRWVEVRAQ